MLCPLDLGDEVGKALCFAHFVLASPLLLPGPPHLASEEFGRFVLGVLQGFGDRDFASRLRCERILFFLFVLSQLPVGLLGLHNRGMIVFINSLYCLCLLA